jgi:hypothetical protein
MTDHQSPDALVPGLVLHVDTDELRALGGSTTNAQVTADEDRAVRGAHDFLVLVVDVKAGSCLALPLFPRSAPGSAPLNPVLQHGAAPWGVTPVFYSRWQHWRIPLEAVRRAERPSGDTGNDDGADSTAAERRSYAIENADARQDLANWATRNRCAFRPA